MIQWDKTSLANGLRVVTVAGERTTDPQWLEKLHDLHTEGGYRYIVFAALKYLYAQLFLQLLHGVAQGRRDAAQLVEEPAQGLALDELHREPREPLAVHVDLAVVDRADDVLVVDRAPDADERLVADEHRREEVARGGHEAGRGQPEERPQ